MKVCHELDKTKDIKIKFTEEKSELANESKLLGVTIDQHLDWKSHVNKITK